MNTSRIINVIGLILTVLASLQVGGAYELLPPKVVAFLVVLGGVLSAFSERIQGGISKTEN